MNDNHDATSRRAYAIWEQAGRPHGQDEEHWQQALRELGILPAVDLDNADRRMQGLEDLPGDASAAPRASTASKD
jgi:hypothetical protein